MSKSDSWFPAISADLLVACSTTQHCLVIAQCNNCHTVLNITKVNLPHSAGCAACHTQQSFVTNRSTPPSAATALYQAAVSHWFPCSEPHFQQISFFPFFQIQLSTDFQDGHQAEQEDGGHLKHPQEGWRSSKGEWPDLSWQENKPTSPLFWQENKPSPRSLFLIFIWVWCDEMFWSCKSRDSCIKVNWRKTTLRNQTTRLIQLTVDEYPQVDPPKVG